VNFWSLENGFGPASSGRTKHFLSKLSNQYEQKIKDYNTDGAVFRSRKALRISIRFLPKFENK